MSEGEKPKTRTFNTEDVFAFFREKGVPLDVPCSVCRRPHSFRVFNPGDEVEVWPIDESDDVENPQSDTFFEYCVNCGYAEGYYLKPLRDWLRKKWGL